MNESITPRARAKPLSMMVVVVLYRLRPADSVSFQTLMQSAAQVPKHVLDLRILLYDNASDTAGPIDVPEGVRIYRAARNAGLAGAYNYALELSRAENCSWLLTLDQDTALPVNALRRLTELALQFEDSPDVAAIVPELIENGIVQSPLFVKRWHARRLPVGYCGFPEAEITVMNSCCMWKTDHLLEIGGFDRRFWLDYLDYVMCHRTFRSGRRVYVSGDIRVEHQLSLVNWRERLTPQRLENILAAESAFNDLYKAPVDRLLLTLKLIVLLWKRKLKREDPRFLQVLRSEVRRRLLRSRKARLAEWRSSVELRLQQ